MYNESILIIIGKIYKKYRFTTYTTVLLFCQVFTELISTVTYVSVNKQLIIFQSCFTLVSRPGQRKG